MFKKQTPEKPGRFTSQVVDEVLATTSVERVQGVVRDIGRNTVTTRADVIRHQTDEGMIWQSAPSLMLLIVPILVSFVVLFAALIGAKIVQTGILHAREQAATQGIQHSASARGPKSGRQRSTQQAMSMSDEEAAQALGWIGRVPYLLGAILAMAVLWQFLVLKTTRYAATSQRLIIEKGVVLTRNTPHELHDLGDFIIEKPLLLKPFRIGHLKIAGKRVLSNGVPKSTEMPLLIGIRNPEYVRDILRTGGQLEAQRADKLRWR